MFVCIIAIAIACFYGGLWPCVYERLHALIRVCECVLPLFLCIRHCVRAFLCFCICVRQFGVRIRECECIYVCVCVYN
uniref:Uncharacterized protein n=1 Tax=Octopus bimaculoides TaxID=37653 RepID=A0A0L8H031_OCTBM